MTKCRSAREKLILILLIIVFFVTSFICVIEKNAITGAIVMPEHDFSGYTKIDYSKSSQISNELQDNCEYISNKITELSNLMPDSSNTLHYENDINGLQNMINALTNEQQGLIENLLQFKLFYNELNAQLREISDISKRVDDLLKLIDGDNGIEDDKHISMQNELESILLAVTSDSLYDTQSQRLIPDKLKVEKYLTILSTQSEQIEAAKKTFFGLGVLELGSNGEYDVVSNDIVLMSKSGNYCEFKANMYTNFMFHNLKVVWTNEQEQILRSQVDIYFSRIDRRIFDIQTNMSQCVQKIKDSVAQIKTDSNVNYNNGNGLLGFIFNDEQKSSDFVHYTAVRESYDLFELLLPSYIDNEILVCKAYIDNYFAAIKSFSIIVELEFVDSEILRYQSIPNKECISALSPLAIFINDVENNQEGYYSQEQLSYFQKSGRVALLKKEENRLTLFRASIDGKVATHKSYVKSHFDLNDNQIVINEDSLLKERDKVLKYISEIEEFPEGTRITPDCIRNFACLKKMDTAVDSIVTKYIEPCKSVLDKSNVLMGGDFYYSGSVINPKKLEGIIVQKNMFVSAKEATVLMLTKCADSDVTIRTGLNSVLNAYNLVIAKIDELVCAAEGFSDDELYERLLALDFFENKNGNLVASDTIPLDRDEVEPYFEEILADMTSLLTEEQRKYTTIFARMQLVYDKQDELRLAVDTYLNSLFHLNIWEIDSSINRPILNTNGEYAIRYNGLLKNIEPNSALSMFRSQLSDGVSFLQNQLDCADMRKLKIELALLDNAEALLRQDIADMINRYRQLDTQSEILISHKTGLEFLMRILLLQSPIQGIRYLTIEQKEILCNSSNNLLVRIQNDLDLVKDLNLAIIKFEEKYNIFFMQFGDITPNEAKNLCLEKDRLLSLVNMYKALSLEQKSLLVSSVLYESILNSFHSELLSRLQEYEIITNMYQELDKTLDTILNREAEVREILSRMKALRFIEDTFFVDTVQKMISLENVVLEQKDSCSSFILFVQSINGNPQNILSQKNMILQAFIWHDSFTSIQKTMLGVLVCKQQLDEYTLVCDSLLLEVAACESSFIALGIFENDILNISKLMLNSELYSNEINSLILNINGLSREQQSILVAQIRLLNDALRYIGEKDVANSLLEKCTDLIEEIGNRDEYFILANDKIAALLSQIMDSNETIRNILKIEITVLNGYLNDIKESINVLSVIEKEFRSLSDGIISNSVKIDALYNKVALSLLTTEQKNQLKERDIYQGILKKKDILDSALESIENSRTAYQLLKDATMGYEGMIGIENDMLNLKSSIERLSKEERDSLSDIQISVTSDIATIKGLKENIEKVVNDARDIPMIKNGLIAKKESVYALVVMLDNMTVEQKNILASKPIDYVTFIMQSEKILHELLDTVNEIKERFVLIPNSYDGLIAYKDMLHGIKSLFHDDSLTMEQLSLLNFEIEKCERMLNIIDNLIVQISDIQKEIKALPELSKLSKADSEKVVLVSNNFNRLTSEQKGLMNKTLSEKLAAIILKLKNLYVSTDNSSAEVDVSDDDLKKDILITIGEVAKSDVLFSVYDAQISSVFYKHQTAKVFLLSANSLSTSVTLSNHVAVRIFAETDNYFIAKIMPGGVVSKVDSNYVKGHYVFVTSDMAVYILVSNETEPFYWLYFGVGFGIIILGLVVFFVLRMFVPSFSVIRSENECKIKIKRMSKVIKNYRFYVNGVSLNDNIFLPTEGELTLCYSYRQMFFYTENLSDMTDCKIITQKLKI